MPGFFVSNINISCELNNFVPEYCVKQCLNIDKGTVCRNTLNKFMADKVFAQDNEIVAVLEGVLLNKKQLFQRFKTKSVFTLIKAMYYDLGDVFFDEFRGVFSGALYLKKEDKWLIYTCHTGENPIYYAQFGGVFYAGSQVDYVLEACNQREEKLTFSEAAAYQILTYAFMTDDSTYANEIKRLRGGMYLCVKSGKISVYKYHELKKHPERFENYTEQQIIEVLDEGFRNAVALEYEKDKEYGYNHLADMSGGLDSRMSAWVAHCIEPKHIQLMTFCRADSLDEVVAKQIAQYWKDEIVVKPLDDCSYLYDIDENTKLLGGLSLYSGITGGKRLLESLNMEKYGLEHTGMIGDVVIGSFLSKKRGKACAPTGRYSERLAYRYQPIMSFDDELFLIYTRGLQGACNANILRKNYTECTSPFMYIDFLQLCLDIPAEMRMEHNLYKKWILRKYPEAAQYRWEAINAKINTGRLGVFVKKVVTKGPAKLLKLLGINADKIIPYGMNPLDYWLQRDVKLRTYMDEYMKNSMPFLKELASAQLISDVEMLYKQGNAFEKTMTLTLLSAVKLYFGGKK